MENIANKCELINIDSDYDMALNLAINIYQKGDIFVSPTDTIYGFGGDPFSKKAVQTVYRLKERAQNKRFILLSGSVEKTLEIVKCNNAIEEILYSIWPNPISVILNLKEEYVENLESTTIAIRIPRNKFCTDICNNMNSFLISTSVNKSSNESLNNPDEIYTLFGNDLEYIFYSKAEVENISSTVLDLSKDEPRVIRMGSFDPTDLIKKIYKS